jgi:hypothetical protein
MPLVNKMLRYLNNCKKPGDASVFLSKHNNQPKTQKRPQVFSQACTVTACGDIFLEIWLFYMLYLHYGNKAKIRAKKIITSGTPAILKNPAVIIA